MSILNNKSDNNAWEDVETIPLHGDDVDEDDNDEYDSSVDAILAETTFISSPQKSQHVINVESPKTSHIIQVESPKNSEIFEIPSSKSSQILSPVQTKESKNGKTHTVVKILDTGSRSGSSVASINDGEAAMSQFQQDSRSFREKLKDRINVVKEQAGKSANASRKNSESAQKSSKQNAISRMTELLFKEEADVEAALEKHRRAKESKKRKNTSRKQSRFSTQMENIEAVGYKEGIEFFTKSWESSDNLNARIASNSNLHLQTDDNAISPDEDDGNKLLAADYLGLKDSILDPVEFKNPVIIDNDQRLQQEQQMLFWPTTDPVAPELRIGPDKELRDFKEEGLYVPEYPKVKPGNMNKFHQRLIKSKNLKWFGEDGEAICCPDPLERNSKFTEREEIDDDKYHNLNLTYYEPAILFGDSKKDGSLFLTSDECYLLELEILNVTFTHHPLYSKEHVISNQLIQLFEKYRNRQNAAYTKRLSTRLEALRKARDNLINVLKRQNNNQEMTNLHQQRLQRYKNEIRETREQRMIEGKNDNILLINLLTTWKQLKKVREHQGYISTPIKLQIIQLENTNTSEWKNEVDRQTEEIIEEMNEKMNLNSSPKDKEPESIKGIDLERIRQKVINDVSESILTPEEPMIDICLAEQKITPDTDLKNPMEIQRRSLLKRSQLWYRIFYNGHEVCKSTTHSLDSQFTCSFNQKLTIRIEEWPETLSVQIYSDAIPNKGIFSDSPMAEIYIPIPTKGITLRNSSVEHYEFSSQQIVDVGVRHSGVGSGCQFKLFPEDGATLCLYTTAALACKTGWGTYEDRVQSPPEEYFDYVNTRRRNPLPTSMNTTVLKEWMKSTQLDPNDPNNATFFEFLKKADADSSVQPDTFCLNSVQELFDFCSEDDLLTNPRLRLLMLRDREEMEFKNIKAIPIREWEIPEDIFKTYEKRVSNPDLPFDTVGFGQLEIRRAWGHHSLNAIYDRILKQCRLSQQLRTTEDVVHEEKVPSIGTLGLTFMKLLQPKRPLRPRRKGRKRIPVKGLTGQEVKVIVNVVRAFEVPIRKDVDVLREEDSISYIRVRPFVEITFKGQTKRTITADGPNPTWNQDLQFSVLNSNESSFHISSMQSFEDSLHLHLFDEIVVDILEDERRRDTIIHERLERNWLGSLRIPFSTLYFNHQVEGTFQLYSPPFLLGYDRQMSSTTTDTAHLRNSTFLTLFIIVQPPLSPPDPIMERLECNESSYIEQHLESWRKEVLKKVPNRPIKTFITDTSGKSVCVTRFFKPISPPTIYEGETITEEMVARFVSLIPVSTSGALIFGHFNIWLTCDQIMRLLLGEREDHAVLLCCFLMKLGLKVWLLLGNGIPHGHSAYVLTRHDTPVATPVYNIWDPVSGLKYSSFDSFSPLHKVYCLINDENIWVNIQTEELVRRTNFDVSQQNDWWPVFDRNIPAPKSSVQPSSIEYIVTSKTDVHLLQDKIEKHLRESIMKWRPTSKTIWNRYCIATLRKLLPILEKEACGIKQRNNSEHLLELQHILSSYKICGFPISQPFTNEQSILDAVKSTGVHLNENPDVEFALAVYIHPYPNDVLSVWVYAVSLTARR